MKIVDILVEYWQYISIGILVIFDVIYIIIKKRPKHYDEFVDAVRDCLIKVPVFIKNVEGVYDSGLERKDQCMSLLLTYIQTKLGRNLSEKELDYFIHSVSWMVESVLETPTKKGGYGREDEEA